MADPFIGEVRLFAGNFAPRGWALCDGRLLAISGNEALFSIIGSTYGGDARSTFAVPDMRQRVPLHPGAGEGLTPRQLGEQIDRQPVQVADSVELARGMGHSETSLAENLLPADCPQPPSLTVNHIIALEGLFPSRA